MLASHGGLDPQVREERMSRGTTLQQALSFAALGALGAWTLGVMLPGHDDELTVPVLVATPVFAGLLGGLLIWRARSVRRPYREVLWVWFPVATTCTGAFTGVVVTFAVVCGNGGPGGWRSCLFGVLASPAGVLVGSVAGAAFIPLLLPSFQAGLCIGRARRDSVIDRSDHRGLWRATAASMAVVITAVDLIVPGDRSDTVPLLADPFGPVLVVALGAALVSLGVLAADAWTFGHLVWSVRLPARGARWLSSVDLGLGEELAEARVGDGSAYRDTGRCLATLRGSPERARRVLGRAVLVDASALVALTMGALHLAWRLRIGAWFAP